MANFTLQEKRENMVNRMYECMQDIIGKDEAYFTKNIKWNDPNKKVYAKNWIIPSINLKYGFMYMIKLHPELLNNSRVKVIYDFFKANDVCVNCSSCEGFCYNWRAYRYTSAIKGRMIRLYQLLVYPELVEKVLSRQVNNKGVYRIHVDGEYYSVEYARMWNRIAGNNPKALFYTYTKAYQIMQEIKEEVPSNLKIQLSYDEATVHQQAITNLYQAGNFNVFYTSSVNEDNKPIYNRLDLFGKAKQVLCKGKCEGCNYCLAGDRRVIKCNLH